MPRNPPFPLALAPLAVPNTARRLAVHSSAASGEFATRTTPGPEPSAGLTHSDAPPPPADGSHARHVANLPALAEAPRPVRVESARGGPSVTQPESATGRAGDPEDARSGLGGWAPALFARNVVSRVSTSMADATVGEGGGGSLDGRAGVVARSGEIRVGVRAAAIPTLEFLGELRRIGGATPGECSMGEEDVQGMVTRPGSGFLEEGR